MKILEKHKALDDNIFQIMDTEGKIKNKDFFPSLKDNEILEAYKNMLFSRTADLQILSYQRQGRIYTYPPNYGQEAIAAAVGSLIREEDWLVPAFREMGAYLAKGASLKEIFLYFMGYEDGSMMKNAKNILPMSVPIASQLVHATGIGYEIKYRKKNQIVYTFVGDGGTSEGDFHEALNFAAVWQVPVVFIIQNNQYGISTPTKIQTASRNLAIKSLAYGMDGIKVDGNDYLAMTTVLQEVQKNMEKEQKPILIEAYTYRKGAHTTSDDPTKYRTKEEEEEWDAKDPLKRMKNYLIAKKMWSEKEEEKIIAQYKKEIDKEFVEAENYPKYPLDDVFKYMYDEIPEDLLQQKRAHEKFLKWQEDRK